MKVWSRSMTRVVLWLLVMAGLPFAAGAELVLVKNGVSQAPVIVFADAPPMIRQAAEELVMYIEQTSGARPELIEGAPEPLPEKAIWVGLQPAVETLFPEVKLSFDHPEEILIAANGQHLLLAGRDKWIEEGLVIEGRNGTVEGRQMEYGTANAVYTFLEDYLGVRWLWPGELGTDVQQQATIAFDPFVYRYHPQFRARAGIFAYSMLDKSGRGRSQVWSRHQRLLLDSLDFPAGHAFDKWWARYHEIHPEIFALQPDGTRGLGSTSPRTVKLCLSNPKVIDLFLQGVEERLEQDPSLRVFNVSPNDGWASGHCVCEDCRAWDHPDGELRTFHWAGLGQQYVALSDRQVTFANRAARALKKTYPDKDYYAILMAYGHSRPAPQEAVPDDNVIIMSVANFIGRSDATDRGSPNNTLHKTQFADWAKVAPHLMWRPNTGSPAGWQQGLFDVYMDDSIADMKFIAANKGRGIFIDRLWEHWSTQGPQYYILAQLTWDPSLDGEAVMQDYYQRAYGPAANTMEQFWNLMQTTRATFMEADKPYHEVYDAAWFEQAYGLLEKATNQSVDQQTYVDRVDFTRSGLDYQQAYIELRQVMKRYWDSGGEDEQAKERALALWDDMRAVSETYPLSQNWHANRPGQPRMSGMHPDDPPNRRPSVTDVDPPDKALLKGAKLVPAEESGWELVFQDDFERDSLGSDWQVLNGDWRVEDGTLIGNGAILTASGYPEGGEPGFLRLEYVATPAVQTMSLVEGQPAPAPRVSDMSAMLQASLPDEGVNAFNSGYFFQFGGYWNTKNSLKRNGRMLQEDTEPDTTIDPQKTHHVVVQNDMGQLTMFIDGVAILSHQDDTYLMGGDQNRAGFYFYTANKVEQVKIYLKRLPNDLDLE